MQVDPLKLFYNQEHIRQAVHEYMHDTLDELALRDIYKGANVSGYKEARDTIDKVFSRLEEMFGERDRSIKTNQAK